MILLSLLAISYMSPNSTDLVPSEPCPEAVIRIRYRDGEIPVQEQVRAHRALKKCHKLTPGLPRTVAEYNGTFETLKTLSEILKDVGYRIPVER